MKMIFTGKVSGEKTVLAAGARHTVKAQAGEQYGLVDEVTGLVPDGVEADRSGDDLILRKKEDSTEVRIEGFGKNASRVKHSVQQYLMLWVKMAR
ncbi:RTX family exoprotein A [Escherichia coli]|nr:RTX family exoprotein A [Escherichia coli]